MARQIGEVLFTFDPEEETEISILEGERVIIYNDDVGEGWVEGENERGERGIFPKNYIRITGDMPAEAQQSEPQESKQLAVQASPKAHQQTIYDEAPENDDWGEYTPATMQNAMPSQTHQPPAYHNEQPAAATITAPSKSKPITTTSNNTSTSQGSTSHNYTEDDESVSAFLGRYLNRFTYFVKSQAEDYILGTLHSSQKQPTISDQLQVVQYGQDGPIWASSKTPFTIQINNYTKGDSRGLFAPQLYYQICKDNAPNVEVKRKYEHFEWLMENFKKKFPVAVLPVLPNKGATEEVQLAKQIKMLNIWAEQVSNNPMLQQSKLIEHFVTVEDKKLFTKARKQSDGDKVVLGANFKVADIHGSAVVSVSSRGEGELKRSIKLHEAFTSQYSGLCRSTGQYQEHCVRYISPPITLLSESCKKLGDSLVEHRSFGTYELGQAFQQSADVIKDINADLTTKPKQSYIDLTDRLWVHRNKLESWPNLFNINELTIEKFKDAATWQAKRSNQQAATSNGQDEPAYNDKLVEIVKNRCDRVVSITQAEINHHTLEMVKDSKHIMQQYLEKQIEMHQELMNKYKKALNYFNDVPEL